MQTHLSTRSGVKSCMLRFSSWYWKWGEEDTFTKENFLYKREIHALVFRHIKGK